MQNSLPYSEDTYLPLQYNAKFRQKNFYMEENNLNRNEQSSNSYFDMYSKKLNEEEAKKSIQHDNQNYNNNFIINQNNQDLVNFYYKNTKNPSNKKQNNHNVVMNRIMNYYKNAENIYEEENNKMDNINYNLHMTEQSMNMQPININNYIRESNYIPLSNKQKNFRNNTLNMNSPNSISNQSTSNNNTNNPFSGNINLHKTSTFCQRRLNDISNQDQLSNRSYSNLYGLKLKNQTIPNKPSKFKNQNHSINNINISPTNSNMVNYKSPQNFKKTEQTLPNNSRVRRRKLSRHNTPQINNNNDIVHSPGTPNFKQKSDRHSMVEMCMQKNYRNLTPDNIKKTKIFGQSPSINKRKFNMKNPPRTSQPPKKHAANLLDCSDTSSLSGLTNFTNLTNYSSLNPYWQKREKDKRERMQQIRYEEIEKEKKEIQKKPKINKMSKLIADRLVSNTENVFERLSNAKIIENKKVNLQRMRKIIEPTYEPVINEESRKMKRTINDLYNWQNVVERNKTETANNFHKIIGAPVRMNQQSEEILRQRNPDYIKKKVEDRLIEQGIRNEYKTQQERQKIFKEITNRKVYHDNQYNNVKSRYLNPSKKSLEHKINQSADKAERNRSCVNNYRTIPSQRNNKEKILANMTNNFNSNSVNMNNIFNPNGHNNYKNNGLTNYNRTVNNSVNINNINNNNINYDINSFNRSKFENDNNRRNMDFEKPKFINHNAIFNKQLENKNVGRIPGDLNMISRPTNNYMNGLSDHFTIESYGRIDTTPNSMKYIGSTLVNNSNTKSINNPNSNVLHSYFSINNSNINNVSNYNSKTFQNNSEHLQKIISFTNSNSTLLQENNLVERNKNINNINSNSNFNNNFNSNINNNYNNNFNTDSGNNKNQFYQNKENILHNEQKQEEISNVRRYLSDYYDSKSKMSQQHSNNLPSTSTNFSNNFSNNNNNSNLINGVLQRTSKSPQSLLCNNFNNNEMEELPQDSLKCSVENLIIKNNNPNFLKELAQKQIDINNKVNFAKTTMQPQSSFKKKGELDIESLKRKQDYLKMMSFTNNLGGEENTMEGMERPMSNSGSEQNYKDYIQGLKLTEQHRNILKEKIENQYA